MHMGGHAGDGRFSSSLLSFSEKCRGVRHSGTYIRDKGMPDEQRSAVPESADEELARLRRLAIVDELLTTLVGALDVREVFARVSEVAGRVLTHDAIALPVITEDR